MIVGKCCTNSLLKPHLSQCYLPPYKVGKYSAGIYIRTNLLEEQYQNEMFFS